MINPTSAWPSKTTWLAPTARSSCWGLSDPGGLWERAWPTWSHRKGGFSGTAPPGPSSTSTSTSTAMRCRPASRGLFLTRESDQRLAILVRDDDRIRTGDNLVIEVMAAERSAAERFLRDLREAMCTFGSERHVISLTSDGLQNVTVKFHRPPSVAATRSSFPTGCSSGLSVRPWVSAQQPAAHAGT